MPNVLRAAGDTCPHLKGTANNHRTQDSNAKIAVLPCPDLTMKCESVWPAADGLSATLGLLDRDRLVGSTVQNQEWRVFRISVGDR